MIAYSSVRLPAEINFCSTFRSYGLLLIHSAKWQPKAYVLTLNLRSSGVYCSLRHKLCSHDLHNTSRILMKHTSRIPLDWIQRYGFVYVYVFT